MKIKSIVSQLEGISKKDLVVEILTSDKVASFAETTLSSSFGMEFKVNISLTHTTFGNDVKPEFAIQSKEVSLVEMQSSAGNIVEIDADTRSVIEKFFRNFIVPDIKWKSKNQ